MVIPELEKQLLQLSPNDKLYIIQLLAQSLTTHNTYPEQTTTLVEFFRQSPLVLWGNLVGQLEHNGHSLPAMDSLIAALAKPAEGIALENSLSLVTRNENDFAGTGVVIVNPWSI
jgi:hypothetical protein